MSELKAILNSTWGAESWIQEGWEQITQSEKLLITQRMQKLFENGLPFELKHDKLTYIHFLC